MPPKRGRGRGRGIPPAQQVPSAGILPGETSQLAEATPGKSKKVNPELLGLEFGKKVTLQPSSILQRPPGEKGHGKGRTIRLRTNCYDVEPSMNSIYHYDVTVTSERAPSAKSPAAAMTAQERKYSCMNTKRNREVVNEMLTKSRFFDKIYAAFDGRKNLFTTAELGGKFKEKVVMHEDGKDDVFEVVIQPVEKRETRSCAINIASVKAYFTGVTNDLPQEAIMAIETILRHSPCLRYVPVGRSFFSKPNLKDVPPLGGGREIWYGYHQSVRVGEWGPYVNINMTATAFFRDCTVLQFIEEFLKIRSLGSQPLRDNDIIRLSKEMKTLRIQVNHLKHKRKYRVLKFTRENATNLKFPFTDNQGKTTMKSVSDYFRDQYKIKLKYPFLPCIQVAPDTKKVYLPIEVCSIVKGQHSKKKLDEKQMADMIKFTSIRPDKRFAQIENTVRSQGYSTDDRLEAFGINVSQEPIKVDGHVINAPTLMYKNNKTIRPKDGVWDIRNNAFSQGAELNNWVLLSFADERDCNRGNLERFAKMLQQVGGEMGMRINRPSVIDIINARVFVGKLLKEMEDNKAQLAILVIPPYNKSLYGDIKQAAETTGQKIKTQCIRQQSVVAKCNPPLVGNLCQKINAKMGGINHTLIPGEKPEIFKKPVIIIGADVTHPGPSADIKPSLAAAVGSLDHHPSRYAVAIKAQTNVDQDKKSIEIIIELQEMVKDLLKAFYKNTRQKPEKIIFYRDGVSEGQFEQVLEKEVNSIRKACNSLQSDYEPAITFIVVQKRHHVRFIPDNERDGVGRMGNIPPGTTVDTRVTHKTNFDFFLCSHFGLQGTSRPSHYTVLLDDNKFTADELQKLTYYLCHTYVRCTRSISIPAPVAYAHLAAYRARQHLVAKQLDSDTESVSTFSYHELPQTIIDAIKVTDELKDSMYYV